MVWTKQEGGRVDLGSWSRCLAEYIWDRESALAFLEPGQYERVKLNLVKDSAHWAWCGFKCLVVIKYSKFE